MKLHPQWLIAPLLAVALLPGQSAEPSKTPKVGDKAPLIEGKDQDGKDWKLADVVGKKVVLLYFYPKDDTPGCTRQACAFRDDWSKFAAIGAQVVGMSVDDVESHLDFAKEHKLPFPLLADTGGAVAARYGSLRDLGLIKFARRNTFLIDPQGRIAQDYLSANASRNSREVLEDLERLRRG